MRRLSLLTAVAAAFAVAGAGSAGFAQTAVTPKRRPSIPAARPAPAPAPPPRGLPTPPARLSLSSPRSPGDGGTTCRSACARTRYACEVQEESCAPQWTSCLKTCSDAAAAPQGALLPR